MRHERNSDLCEKSSRGDIKTMQLLIETGVPTAIASRMRSGDPNVRSLLMKSFSHIESDTERKAAKQSAILDFCKAAMFRLGECSAEVLAEIQQERLEKEMEVDMYDRISDHIETNFSVSPPQSNVIHLGSAAVRATA